MSVKQTISNHTEYPYAPAPPDVIPPIGDRHMIHLLYRPEFVEEDAFCLFRFPKKMKEKLKCKGEAVNPGWGLQFVDGWDMREDLDYYICGLRNGKFVGCDSVAGAWNESFAIAANIAALATVSIGFVQALLA